MDYDLVVSIDGACSGCTGNLGMGGVIKKSQGEWLHAFNFAVETSSIEGAHYLAIIEALEYILKNNISVKSILIETDSHVIMTHAAFKASFVPDNLKELIEKVKELRDSLSCSLNFSWVAEEDNFAAKALAYKSANMPFAVVENNCIVPLEQEFQSAISQEQLTKLPEINAKTSEDITRLNGEKYVSPSELISLMTNGMDKYSRAKNNDLLKFIELRFGTETRDYVMRALGDLDSTYSKNALKWIARGLRPDLAFRKAAIEIEIKEII